MGRAATGVKGIDLADSDRVIGLCRVTADDARDLLTVTANGYGKRTPLREYLVQQEDGTTRLQSRGGKGRRDIHTGSRNGPVVALRAVEPHDDLVLISAGGMIMRIDADSVRQTGRGAQGVRMMNLIPGDTLAAVAPIAEDEVQTPAGTMPHRFDAGDGPGNA